MAPFFGIFILHGPPPNHPDSFFYRGGPENRQFPYGFIIVTAGHYVSGSIDWDPTAPSVTVWSGTTIAQLDDKIQCFSGQGSRINDHLVPYQRLGPNSNTVVKTLLDKCGIHPNKPVTIAFGWGSPDI